MANVGIYDMGPSGTSDLVICSPHPLRRFSFFSRGTASKSWSEFKVGVDYVKSRVMTKILHSYLHWMSRSKCTAGESKWENGGNHWKQQRQRAIFYMHILGALTTLSCDRPCPLVDLLVYYSLYDKWNNIPHYTQTEKYERAPYEPALSSYYAHHP